MYQHNEDADMSMFQIYSNYCSQLVCSPVFCFLQKREFDVDNLSKPELRMLLSIMEGELEARDLVIEALRVSYWVVVVYFFFFLNSLLPLLLYCA